MPVIDNLMKRLGYVRLSSYGLVLTPDGRVLSLRPAALDDGIGGRIVGWREGDLAAMELEKWEPARPASPAAMTSPVAVVPPRPPVPTRPISAPPPRVPVAAPVVAPVEPPVAVPAVAPAPAPVAVVTQVAPKVAPAPVVEEDEDEWEWTIALARARAVEADAPVAAAAMMAPRRRADTLPPPVAVPRQPAVRVAARPDPIPEDSWPKTEPLTSIDYNDYTSPTAEVARVIRMAATPRVTLPARVEPAPPARASATPRTVIPVPNLPSAGSARFEPVVRAAAPTPPRRLAKGTGPHLPRMQEPVRAASIAPQAPPARTDDTIPNLTLPPVARLPRAPRG